MFVNENPDRKKRRRRSYLIISEEALIISLLNQLFKQTVHHLSIITTGDVVNNQTNYQVTSAIVTHFMNDTGVCWIIRRTVFNAHIFLNYG